MARRSSACELNIRNVVIAVVNEPIATPARINVETACARPTRARPYTTPTVINAPTNAAIGITSAPRIVAGQCSAIAITAPSPAPEATPMMYGSASGLRNSP